MGLLKSLTGGDVLSAGSGLLGGIIGGISANHAAKKQYEYQRKLNEQSVHLKLRVKGLTALRFLTLSDSMNNADGNFEKAL